MTTYVPDLQFLSAADGETIAYRSRQGKQETGDTKRQPGLIFLPGFCSDMEGNKALALDTFAAAEGLEMTRFDYFGHGTSSGDFAKGTISRWLGDTLSILDEVCVGRQILVGSSMGGWLALLAALRRPERVSGLLLIAPAPDFTARLKASLPAEALAAYKKGEPWMRPSAYQADPYPVASALLDDGEDHLILGGPIEISCPVHILHGQKDPDVPWELSLKLVECLVGDDVRVTFVKEGDHRLSSAQDLALLKETVASLLRLAQ